MVYGDQGRCPTSPSQPFRRGIDASVARGSRIAASTTLPTWQHLGLSPTTAAGTSTRRHRCPRASSHGRAPHYQGPRPCLRAPALAARATGLAPGVRPPPPCWRTEYGRSRKGPESAPPSPRPRIGRDIASTLRQRRTEPPMATSVVGRRPHHHAHAQAAPPPDPTGAVPDLWPLELRRYGALLVPVSCPGRN